MIDLDQFQLDRNSHSSIDEGGCIMELVSCIAGEEWSDHPACASPVVAAFLRNWNDDLPDDQRQTLKPYLPRVLNSRGTDEIELQRSFLALDWLVRLQTPAWLDLAGLGEHASALRALPPITTNEDIATAQPPIHAAGAAARAAAGAAAEAAARAALAPTVALLQLSAHDLVDRMLQLHETGPITVVITGSVIERADQIPAEAMPMP